MSTRSLLGLTVSLVGLVGLAACGDSKVPGEPFGVGSEAVTTQYGVDYSFARPSPASITAAGYTFVVRYSSNDPGKNLSASEAQSLEQAGLDIVCNWEDGAMNALSGYNQGVTDAQTANAQTLADGMPSGRPIYFSIDFDEDSSQAGAVDAYFQGVASVIGLSRTGAYGGYYAINQLFNAGDITFGWQTYAWSSGMWDSRAQLRQIQNGVDNGQEDEDEGMVADFGQWGPNAPTTPDWAAAFVSQSFPLATTALQMVEGQTISSYIELKNVGTKTWDSNTKIGTTQPRDRASVFADSSWVAPNRAARVTGTVPPGGTYKFQFDLHAPSKSGTFDEYFGVVEEGVAWFSDPGQGGPPDNDLEVQIAVSPGEYEGTFVSQSYPLAPAPFVMEVGQDAQGWIELTNSGTKPWVAGTTKLAPIPRDQASPFADSSWLSPTRVSTLTADVPPGQTGRFPLSINATAAGDFELTLGLVEESVTWFADAPLGGGPADGFLRVHVTVGAGLDGGMAPADDASADGGVDDAAIREGSDDDGGITGQPVLADGGQPGKPGATGGAVAKGSRGGGCHAGSAGDPGSLAPLAIVGLLLVRSRRRRR
jgi:MYXO-CTERM domain-containing protein